MRTFSKLTLAAGIGLAMALTFSCHDGGNDEPGASSTGGAANSSPSGGSSSSVNNGTGGSSSSGRSSSSVNISVGDSSGTFKDSRDGQTYKWVKIGTQIWMAQNLNYFEPWVGPTRGNKCYDSKDANCEKYGRLYEWDDAIRLCPDGWHLPTKAEWDVLISTVGSEAGKKLKLAGDDWRDGTGTNIYGFGALPGGILTSEFAELNTKGFWWTSTENDYGTSHVKKIENNNDVWGYNDSKTNQSSVRCVEGYSSSSSVTYGEITDKRDNKKYATVKIGTQTWMAQNLNFAGTNPQIGLCYNNKTENCNNYGRLYTWAAAMNVSEDYNSKVLNALPGQHQGICPDGWHLPTTSEWNALISFIGGYPGKKLKTRSSEWGDNYGTNIYGFGALPGGILTSEFAQLNAKGFWWTSTEKDSGTSDIKKIEDNNDIWNNNGWGSNLKTYSLSIRCVED